MVKFSREESTSNVLNFFQPTCVREITNEVLEEVENVDAGTSNVFTEEGWQEFCAKWEFQYVKELDSIMGRQVLYMNDKTGALLKVDVRSDGYHIVICCAHRLDYDSFVYHAVIGDDSVKELYEILQNMCMFDEPDEIWIQTLAGDKFKFFPGPGLCYELLYTEFEKYSKFETIVSVLEYFNTRIQRDISSTEVNTGDLYRRINVRGGGTDSDRALEAIEVQKTYVKLKARNAISDSVILTKRANFFSNFESIEKIIPEITELIKTLFSNYLTDDNMCRDYHLVEYDSGYQVYSENVRIDYSKLLFGKVVLFGFRQKTGFAVRDSKTLVSGFITDVGILASEGQATVEQISELYIELFDFYNALDKALRESLCRYYDEIEPLMITIKEKIEKERKQFVSDEQDDSMCRVQSFDSD